MPPDEAPSSSSTAEPASPPPPCSSAFITLACAIRSRVRAVLAAAGAPSWFGPADLASLLAGAGAGSALTLLFQPLLGAWIFAEGCFYVWQSYRSGGIERGRACMREQRKTRRHWVWSAIQSTAPMQRAPHASAPTPSCSPHSTPHDACVCTGPTTVKGLHFGAS